MKFRPLAERLPLKDLIQERIQNRTLNNGLFVQNENGKAVVRIYDVIGWPFIEAQDVAAQLDQIEADEIEVQINSPGGDAFEGVAIFNALRAHPARITTRVDGLAASAASIIMQAGDHRVILSGAQVMIHDAWGLAIGNADVMRSTGDILDKLSDNLAGIYSERADQDGFRDLMLAETWFTDDEAVGAGLADEVVKPTRQNRAEIETTKLSNHLASVRTGVEEVVDRVAQVKTLRVEQGKELGHESMDEAEKLLAAADRLRDVVTPGAEPPVPSGPDPQAAPVVGSVASRHNELDQIEAESVAIQT